MLLFFIIEQCTHKNTKYTCSSFLYHFIRRSRVLRKLPLYQFLLHKFTHLSIKFRKINSPFQLKTLVSPIFCKHLKLESPEISKFKAVDLSQFWKHLKLESPQISKFKAVDSSHFWKHFVWMYSFYFKSLFGKKYIFNKKKA